MNVKISEHIPTTPLSDIAVPLQFQPHSKIESNWTLTLSSAQPSHWDPFRTFPPSRHEELTFSVRRLSLVISMESLREFSGPMEFVLRVWDSRNLPYLGKPLNFGNVEQLKLGGDGELARWQVTPDGRLLIGSTQIGLSPEIHHFVKMNQEPDEDSSMEISFSRLVEDFSLVHFDTLLGRVLTLEATPMTREQAYYPFSSAVGTRSPASVSATLLVR